MNLNGLKVQDNHPRDTVNLRFVIKLYLTANHGILSA